MTTSREKMYWTQFKQYIHYDEEKNEYYYDAELPEKARLSFEKWKKEFYD